MIDNDLIVRFTDPILITGANGFIGARVVDALLDYGFSNLRCLVRPSSNLATLNRTIARHPGVEVELIRGNLLSDEDCAKSSLGARVIYHLAAARGEKSYASAYLNTVVTTRNLLTGAARHGSLRRFVNVSSFTVYSNSRMQRGGLLDESCDVEPSPQSRGEAYCYAKVRQEEMVVEHCRKHNIPYVILRPGVVYGPGNKGIHGRVGISTFGIFLHLGGANKIPLTYVDNCAYAVVLAGLKKNGDNQIFNVVDDDLPTSKQFLLMYKDRVRHFHSIYVPYRIFYLFCCLWEKYSEWSQGQLPPAFNRKLCSAYWKGNQYSNDKLKKLLGWEPKVPFEQAAKRYFDYQKGVQERQ